MESAAKLLSFEWFLRPAAIGIASGYALRVLEHFIWAVKLADEAKHRERMITWATMILPQTVMIGGAIGYVFLAILGLYVKNEATLELCAYFVTAVLAFIASDLRELLRRVSRI